MMTCRLHKTLEKALHRIHGTCKLIKESIKVIETLSLSQMDKEKSLWIHSSFFLRKKDPNADILT